MLEQFLILLVIPHIIAEYFEEKIPGLYFLHIPDEDKCYHKTEYYLVKNVLRNTYKPYSNSFINFNGFIFGLYFPQCIEDY